MGLVALHIVYLPLKTWIFLDTATCIVSIDGDKAHANNLVLPKTYSLNVIVQDSNDATASTTLTVDIKSAEVVHLDMNGNTNDIADDGTIADNGKSTNGASVANGDTLVLEQCSRRPVAPCDYHDTGGSQ